jgi:hypothetical protein
VRGLGLRLYKKQVLVMHPLSLSLLNATILVAIYSIVKFLELEIDSSGGKRVVLGLGNKRL